MISRRKVVTAGAAIAGLATFGIGRGARAATAVKFSYFPSFTSLPIMVAVRQGIFTKHGIEANLVQLTSGGAIQAALVSKSVDFVINPPQLHLQTVEKGQDVRMFLNNFNAPIWSIVFTKQLATPNMAKGYPQMLVDLKGQKIGVTGRGSVQELVWRYMFKDAGLDPERDVSFISVGTIATATAALQQNMVQTFLASEPMQSMIEEGDYATIALDLWKGQGPEVFRKDWVTNCWATRGDLVQKSPAMVKSVAAAIREAHAFMKAKENFPKVLDVAGEIAPTAKPLLSRALPRVLEVMGPELPRSAIDATNRFLVDNGLLKEAMPVEKVLFEV